MGTGPDAGLVNGDFPPAQNLLAFFLHDLLKGCHLRISEVIITMGKDHAHPVTACFRQVKAQHAAFPFKKIMGDLQHNAGTVTGIFIRTAGTAVTEILQYGQSVFYNLMGFFALDMGYKSHPTCIMLERWIVQSLFAWQPVIFHITTLIGRIYRNYPGHPWLGIFDP